MEVVRVDSVSVVGSGPSIEEVRQVLAEEALRLCEGYDGEWDIVREEVVQADGPAQGNIIVGRVERGDVRRGRIG